MPERHLLDLFCGAGGATKGYQRAGFYVIGVDIEPQPNYCGDQFFQIDALAYLRHLVAGRRWGWRQDFDAIHASPPCQGYSAMSSCRPGLADKYPRLIEPVRELLVEMGLPYVIENVVGAPLIDPVMLCGRMFDRQLFRHRLFEVSGFDLPQPEHTGSMHLIKASKAGHWKPGTTISVAGNCAPIALAREVMDIDWTNRNELGEAIPPYFTEYVGQHLMSTLRDSAPPRDDTREPSKMTHSGSSSDA